MTDRSNRAITDLFVPDFCQPQAVAIIVIGAELLAFTLVVAGANSWTGGIEQLATTSLYVQWAALVSAGLLCVSRQRLVQLLTWQSALIAFSIPMLVNLALTLAVHLLQHQGMLSGSWTAASSLPLDLLSNLTITAIVSGVMLRYLYLRHETAKSLAAEHQSRIDALQSRIRPHFLFNSLNTIISLVREQPVRAEEALQDLAELFRHNLRQTEQLVSLQDDIELCKQYLALEQLRLGERLRVNWKVSGLNHLIKIPPLVLQPLLENAVYHGIEPLTEQGIINISANMVDAGGGSGSTSETNSYAIAIENPLPTNRGPHNSSGHQIAIDNIRQRLQAHFGEPALLTVEISESIYRVTVNLPQLDTQ